MVEKIYIEELTDRGVNIRKQQYITVDNIQYPIGEPNRNSCTNSVQGRQALQAEVAEPYLTAIMTVWGDTPTITEEPTQ